MLLSDRRPAGIGTAPADALQRPRREEPAPDRARAGAVRIGGVELEAVADLGSQPALTATRLRWRKMEQSRTKHTPRGGMMYESRPRAG